MCACCHASVRAGRGIGPGSSRVHEYGKILTGPSRSNPIEVCELSNKPKVSKAGPLSKDIMSVVLYNMIGVVFIAGFGVLGLSVAAAAGV